MSVFTCLAVYRSTRLWSMAVPVQMTRPRPCSTSPPPATSGWCFSESERWTPTSWLWHYMTPEISTPSWQDGWDSKKHTHSSSFLFFSFLFFSWGLRDWSQKINLCYCICNVWDTYVLSLQLFLLCHNVVLMWFLLFTESLKTIHSSFDLWIKNNFHFEWHVFDILSLTRWRWRKTMVGVYFGKRVRNMCLTAFWSRVRLVAVLFLFS